MFYIQFKKLILILTISIGVFLSMISHASQIPPQPLATALPAKSGSQTITDDWLVKLPLNNNFDAKKVEWLDNTHLIYPFSVDNSSQSMKIELIDIHTGSRTTLSEGSAPLPSPDGQWIAFTKGTEKERQLWLMRNNGTEPKQLTHVQNGLGTYQFDFNIAWSSDSKHIALSYSLDASESVIDVINIANLKLRRILSINQFQLRSLSWSPDNKELLFWKEQIEGQGGAKEDHEYLQLVRLADGQVRTLAQFDGVQQLLSPKISRDGKQIVIAYDPEHPYFDTTQNIGLISTNDLTDEKLPSIKQLTYDVKLYSPQWSHDSKSIYALRVYGAYKQLYNINVQTGKQKQITNAPFSIYWNSYALSPDGTQIAWIAFNAHATRIIRVASTSGENVRDLITISEVPDNMSLSEVREIDWDTINYPSRMRGLLVLPLHYQEGKRYPLIVDIHGGGPSASLLLCGGMLVSTPLEWQMWAAKGYAVFIPEFRSSGAFGGLAETRDDLQEHDIINQDIVDVETGVNALVSSGIIDNQRVAIFGHSAGARRANWLTVTRNQFKTVVSKEGWADELTDALNPSEFYPIKRVSHLYGGTPQEVPQNYLKNSALSHSDGAITSTLFLMGNPKLGGADLHGTVNLLHEAIKKKGIETQLVYYSDEGHVFEKTKNRLDMLKRIEKWIDEHLKEANNN